MDLKSRVHTRARINRPSPRHQPGHACQRACPTWVTGDGAERSDAPIRTGGDHRQGLKGIKGVSTKGIKDRASGQPAHHD